MSHIVFQVISCEIKQSFHTFFRSLLSPKTKILKLTQLETIAVSTVPKTYVRRPWLIVSVNLGYSFNVHAWLPLRVATSKQWRTRMLLPNAGSGIVVSFNVLVYRLSWHDQSRPPCIRSGAVGVTMAWDSGMRGGAWCYQHTATPPSGSFLN